MLALIVPFSIGVARNFVALFEHPLGQWFFVGRFQVGSLAGHGGCWKSDYGRSVIVSVCYRLEVSAPSWIGFDCGGASVFLMAEWVTHAHVTIWA